MYASCIDERLVFFRIDKVSPSVSYSIISDFPEFLIHPNSRVSVGLVHRCPFVRVSHFQMPCRGVIIIEPAHALNGFSRRKCLVIHVVIKNHSSCRGCLIFKSRSASLCGCRCALRMSSLEFRHAMMMSSR